MYDKGKDRWKSVHDKHDAFYEEEEHGKDGDDDVPICDAVESVELAVEHDQA